MLLLYKGILFSEPESIQCKFFTVSTLGYDNYVFRIVTKIFIYYEYCFGGFEGIVFSFYNYIIYSFIFVFWDSMRCVFPKFRWGLCVF